MKPYTPEYRKASCLNCGRPAGVSLTAANMAGEVLDTTDLCIECAQSEVGSLLSLPEAKEEEDGSQEDEG